MLTAIDHEGNRYYAAEHYAENLPDRLHAQAYKKLLKTFDLLDSNGQCLPTLGIYADPGGAGAQAIINLSDSGIYAQAVPKDAGSVKASIELIRRAAYIDPMHSHPVTGVKGAPHVFFLKSLRSTWRVAGVDYNESRLMWELRQYRQKENAPPDTPIKELDDCTDCARYLEIVRPFSPIYVDPADEEQAPSPDSLSRRAHDEFKELAERAMRPKLHSEADFWL